MIALLVAATTACSPCIIQNVRVEVGDGTVIGRTNVGIAHGKIVSLSGSMPPMTQVLDGEGKTLAPGFIAAESDLGTVEVSLEPSANDTEMHGAALTPGFSVAWGFNPLSIWIPIVREEGVTNAVIAPSGGLLAGQAAWVSLTGSLASAPDPAHPVAMFGDVGADAAGRVGGARGAVWLQLRQAFADARFYKKSRADYEAGEARPLSLTPLHLEALLSIVDGTLPLVVHANRASDILEAIAFAKAEKVKLVIAGGAEAWKVLDQLTERAIPVIIEPSTQEPSSFDRLASRDDLATLLERANIPLLISASGSPIAGRRLRQEAGIAVGNGLSHSGAVRAITLAVARAFGRDSEYGSVETGKRANVVLWSGDPLELSSVAEHIWIDGEEQSLSTRQRELAERYRTKQ